LAGRGQIARDIAWRAATGAAELPGSRPSRRRRSRTVLQRRSRPLDLTCHPAGRVLWRRASRAARVWTPSALELRVNEDKAVSRAQGWDRLLPARTCAEPTLPTTPRCRDWCYLKTATSRVPVPPFHGRLCAGSGWIVTRLDRARRCATTAVGCRLQRGSATQARHLPAVGKPTDP